MDTSLVARCYGLRCTLDVSVKCQWCTENGVVDINCRAHEHVCGLLEHTFIPLFLQTDIVRCIVPYFGHLLK